MRAGAQEAHPPQASNQERPTHGIIRRPQPKPAPTGETAKPAASNTEHGKAEPAKADAKKAEPGKPEAGKAPVHAKPAAASTEAVATAIANAVRSLEEKEKKKAEPAHAQPVRSARPVRAVPQRRYSVKWPSQRFEVQWAAPSEDRVTLSWGEQEID